MKKKYFLFLALFLVTHICFSQTSPDSIPVGVIRVKRSPVPASYKVELSYTFLNGNKNSKLTTEIPIQISSSDSIYSPYAPQPLNLNLYHEERSDSLNVVDRRKFEANDFSRFNWGKYLSTMNYSFGWSDSVRLDSSQYLFTIDKKGNAICKSLPNRGADSTAKSFENKCNSYAKVLTLWEPAERNKKEGSARMKKVPCQVIVTIYAYDATGNRTLPIEINVDPK